MKQRNLSIDAVKGAAILLVMIGHVFVHNRMEDPYIYDFIKAVQMPLFIIISGFLCGQGRKISDLKSFGTVLKKRAVAYLVPFFSWLTVLHLGDLKTAYATIFFQLDYGLWFLAVLFILTVMVSTAQMAAGKLAGHPVSRALVFWGVYGMLCLILIVQILTGNCFLSPNLTIIYVPFYMLGYVAGNYGGRFFTWNEEKQGACDCKNSRLLQTGAVASAIGFFYLVLTKDLNSMETRMDVAVQMTASLLGSIAIIYGIFYLRDGKIKNTLAKLGNYTLEIYVIHYHFARILNFTDQSYDFYTAKGAAFAAASFAVMSTATFCAIWLMKKLPLADFLFFGKRARG